MHRPKKRHPAQTSVTTMLAGSETTESCGWNRQAEGNRAKRGVEASECVDSTDEVGELNPRDPTEGGDAPVLGSFWRAR